MEKMLERREKIYVALLMLIATAWSVFLLRPILYDEAFNFCVFSSQPLKISLSDYSFPNNHLFYTLLAHISEKLYGNEPWAMRLPALLAGISLIPINYLLARRIFNRDTAILSSALLTGSSILIEYATSARGYSLLILCALLSFYALASVLENHRHSWIVFAVVTALGFYTIPTMLYCSCCALIWFLLNVRIKYHDQPPPNLYRNLVMTIVTAITLTGLLYLPILIKWGLNPLVANQFVLPQTFAVFVNKLWPLFQEIWESWHREIPTVITLIVLSISFYSLFKSARLRQQSKPLLIALPLGTLGAMLITRHTPHSRTLLFLLPFYLQLVAAGIAESIASFGNQKAMRHLPFFALGIAAITTTIVVRSPAIIQSRYNSYFNDAPHLVAHLRQYLRPGDKLISFCPADANILYYNSLYRLPMENIYCSYHDAQRLVLVLLKTQDIKSLLSFYGGPALLKDLSHAKVIIETNEALVYLFDTNS